MKEYCLYRTDSGKNLVGVIPHPGSSIHFSVTVPKGYEKDLTLVVTAGRVRGFFNTRGISEDR